MPPADSAAPPSERQSPVVIAAQRLAIRIESLVAEVDRLRADNAFLRREIRKATAILEAGSAAAAPHAPERRKVTELLGRGHRGPTGAHAHKMRVTPAEVTADVVRAVLVKLGESTAAEITAEINRARATISNGARSGAVSGRAVRFLAERAGALATAGEHGTRRYRLR